VRLLFVVLTAVETLLALTLVFFRATRRTYPGFGRWTIAEGMQAGGYVLMALRGAIPDWLSILGTNALFPLAAVIRLGGARRFFGIGPKTRVWYAVPAAAVLSAALFRYVSDDVAARTAILCLLTMVPIVATAALILRSIPEERPLFSRAIAAALAVVVVALALRTTVALTDPQFALLRETPLQVVTFVGFLLGHVAVTLAFITLNAERMEHELSRAEASLTRTVAELQQALAEVKTLSGLLPVCASCRRIREEGDRWTSLEEYVHRHTEAQFTHGICPECAAKLYPDLLD